MHYQQRKYNLKNYVKSSYKSQKYKGSNRLSNYLQDKNRTLKIQTSFNHSVNVALEVNK